MTGDDEDAKERMLEKTFGVATRGKKRVDASGILPFAVVPTGKEKEEEEEDDDAWQDRVLFLLGRERVRANFDQGGMWADFGGKIKNGAVDNWASKEFFDETMGTVYAFRDVVVRRIRAGDVSAVIDSFLSGSRSFRTYVLRIPHANYPGLFRKRLKADWKDLRVHLPQLFKGNGRLRNEAQEKDGLEWFSVRRLLSEEGGVRLRPSFAAVVRALAASGWGRCAARGDDFTSCTLDATTIANEDDAEAEASFGSIEVHGKLCPCGIDVSVAAPSTMSAPVHYLGGPTAEEGSSPWSEIVTPNTKPRKHGSGRWNRSLDGGRVEGRRGKPKDTIFLDDEEENHHERRRYGRHGEQGWRRAWSEGSKRLNDRALRWRKHGFGGAAERNNATPEHLPGLPGKAPWRDEVVTLVLYNDGQDEGCERNERNQ